MPDAKPPARQRRRKSQAAPEADVTSEVEQKAGRGTEVDQRARGTGVARTARLILDTLAKVPEAERERLRAPGLTAEQLQQIAALPISPLIADVQRTLERSEQMRAVTTRALA